METLLDQSKKLLSKETGETLYACENALINCNNNIEIAKKYLRDYPKDTSFDFWLEHDFRYCEACHKFYPVNKGTLKCTCGYDFKIFL